ncbi:uncharacterized protein LOC109860057 isoform X2 [Pseudomyrmex gracilis]|uniref:uncharacterized protein LOC109860057 isoform X2 n=1 Tax=Pseudomyrmex gracilis TaxID=219809 RepID=UPI000994BA53|nr:uncharacterized protein LOC109860057 isoform X2 [Pseudomyrmex gracilis]
MEGCHQLCKFPIGGEEKILDKYFQLGRVTFYGFSMLGFFLVIALLFLVPVEDGALPVRALYPFDTTKYPWHAVGFFVEACAVSIGITAIIGMDSLHTNLCNLFLVQLEILNMHFQNCSGDALIDRQVYLDVTERSYACYGIFSKDNYDPEKICHSGFTKVYRRSIRSHQRLLAIIDDFNEVFSTGMFIQMLSSTSMICLTGFQATLVSRDKSKCRHGQIVISDFALFRPGHRSELQHLQIYNLSGGGRLAALLHLLGGKRGDAPERVVDAKSMAFGMERQAFR